MKGLAWIAILGALAACSPVDAAGPPHIMTPNAVAVVDPSH